MNDVLKNTISRVKEKLENNPEGILIGQIRKGNPNPEVEDRREVLVEYIEFLKECDGASFGEIDIFPSHELSRNQFYVEMLDRGKEDWLFIGLVLYEPIVINKTNGYVYRFYRDTLINTPEECFGSFDNFIMEYVLGKKYVDLVPVNQGDEWMTLLSEMNLL
ncbi:hypothetical protein L3476_16525 [Paenibacillus thiaminolyticus]|uniref:hypothetical protein n=1 Tax=Paenibacillus thiaminolyticus TaxID=49283 RepID=UPI001161FB5F|nr:hypothetical protein [Paenibacillus thiaminolyticus]NGP61481.1 hypothetical protein [Paenibacillus thiaminolyticus]WCR24982.1 hypothetical protein L3476_16525 [Paenibacillus thiaminolyticus]